MSGRSYLALLLILLTSSPTLFAQYGIDTHRHGITFVLDLEPIPNLTTSWHKIPSSNVIPLTLDTPLTIRVARAGGTGHEHVSYTWRGAEEQSDANGTSTGTFQSPVAGTFTIAIIPNVNNVDLIPVEVAVHVFPLHPDEIRIIFRGLQSDFATFVGNPFTLDAYTQPAEFTDWIEWSAPQHDPSFGFGPRFTTTRLVIGAQYPITAKLVGTIDPPSTSVMIYRVHWVRKPDAVQYVSAPSLRLYHEIRTEPPGYEDHVHWGYDTVTTGDAEPTTGVGEDFWVTRTCTNPHLVCWRVFADNVSDQGDQQPPPDTYLEHNAEQLPNICPSYMCSLPVGVANGEARVDVTDLEVPSRGFNFRWTRTYSSRSHFDGDLGFNWDLNYNRRIFPITSSSLTVTNGSLHEDVYQDLGGGTYGAPVGFFETLVKNGDTTYTQTDGHGMQHIYDASGYLIIERDRDGNQLTITRNANHQIVTIVDTQGRTYSVTYTGGHITMLSDFFQPPRQVVYGYTDSDLTSERSPVVTGTPNGNDFPSGKTTLYQYTSGFADSRLNHNLTSIIDPLYVSNMTPWVTLTYAPTQLDTDIAFDQVVTEQWGNGSVGGTSTYSYASGVTIETDRNGNVREHHFDSMRHETKTIEQTNRNVRPGEGDYTTFRTFSPDGLLLQMTLPRGNAMTYLFDSANPRRQSQRNLLEVRKQSNGVGGSAGDLVSRYTYEPLFNELRTITDPRAFPTGSVPLDSCGLLNLTDPNVVRYTTTRFFDYQEDTGSQTSIDACHKIPDGLGDLNGAPDFNAGHVVKIAHPVVQTAGPNQGDGPLDFFTYNSLGQTLTHTHPAGHITAFTYFSSGPKQGYLQSQTQDSRGLDLVTSYDYDDAGNLVTLIDPKHQDTQYFVNQLNQVVRSRSRMVLGTTRYQIDIFYDLNNDLMKTEALNLDENGSGYTHRIITNTFEHNILHRITAQDLDKTLNTGVIPQSVRTEYSYDANLNRTAVKLPLGNIDTTLYDERNLPYKVTTGDDDTRPANAPPASASIKTFNYDGNRHLIEQIDTIRNAMNPNAPTTIFPGSAPGDVTQYAFDGFDRRFRSIDGEGNQHTSEFDLASNTKHNCVDGPKDNTSFTPVRLFDVTRVYDELNRVVTSDTLHFDTSTGSQIGDGHSAKMYAYDLDGKVVVVTDDRGLHTAIQWDGADRRQKTTDQLGNEVQYAYDDNGNITSLTRKETSTDFGPSSDTYYTAFTYDGIDRTIKSVDPVGDVNESFYDSRSNVVKTSDGVRGANQPMGPGNVVTYDHDALNRLVSTTRILTSDGRGDGGSTGSITTAQTWDDDSRLSAQEDANAHSTLYGYDNLNRLTTTTNADTTVWSRQFDTDNHVIKLMDANGTLLDLSYDGINRLLSRTVGVFGSGVIGGTFENFGYDGMSRVTHTLNDDGFSSGSMACDFRYDSLDNVVTDEQMGLTVCSGYDGVSNRIACSYPAATCGLGTRTFVFGYDDLNRLRSISEGSAGLATFHYRGPTRLEQRTYGDDSSPISKLDCSYDSMPRLIDVNNRFGSNAPIARFEYGYDRMHHRLFEKRAHDGNHGDVYGYDSIYRVEANLENVDLTSVAPGQEIRIEDYSSCDRLAYLYDSVGNRTTITQTDRCISAHANYVHNCVNEYLAAPDGTSPRQAGHPRDLGQNLTYDLNGNLTSDRSKTYSYDFKSRLVEVRDQSTTALIARYSYDAEDRRSMKVDYTQHPTAMTHYFFDGNRVVEERDDFGNVLRQYVWGVGTDQLVQEKAGANIYYAHENAVGSIAALVNASSGTVAERYQYDPFGKTTVTLDGSTGNRIRFHAAYFDDETGLYCMRARYYSPALGRFIQRDPIGVWTDKANLGNAYAFVGNDAINFRDPRGTHIGPPAPGNAAFSLEKKDACTRAREQLERAARAVKQAQQSLDAASSDLQRTEHDLEAAEAEQQKWEDGKLRMEQLQALADHYESDKMFLEGLESLSHKTGESPEEFKMPDLGGPTEGINKAAEVVFGEKESPADRYEKELSAKLGNLHKLADSRRTLVKILTSSLGDAERRYQQALTDLRNCSDADPCQEQEIILNVRLVTGNGLDPNLPWVDLPCR